MASRAETKLRSSSLDRGRSQLAKFNTSLIVTGSMLLVVKSIVFDLFLFLLFDVSI